MQRPNDDIRPALRQGLPGTAQHAIDKNQPGDAVALIERLNERGKQGERECIINPNHQLIFPALVKLNGLFFQLANRMQHVTPFFQQHLPCTGETRAMPGAVKDLDIKIALELLHGVAQSRRGFIELC